jgi:predicted house-cleaning noncanonical NTP pyrophosphatase (MazG superfamily)
LLHLVGEGVPGGGGEGQQRATGVLAVADGHGWACGTQRSRAVAFLAMRVDYHKLVRDGIPRIIEAGGGQPVTRVLDHAGYLVALRAKLMEEAEEARAAPDTQLRSELADLLEVLQALAVAHGMSWEDVVAEATRKRDERGGFGQRILLEYVDRAG